MNHLKSKFMAGGKTNGYKEETLQKIWSDWEKFASYAFNKSHATCYSWVAYQTAFLKANYPSEYMAAVLSRSLSNIVDITKFMDECKAMGIQVLGPDVNESILKFSVDKNKNIRFGLGVVKGVGEAAVQNIIEERRKNGPYKDIFDFVERVNLTACNKKNIESLALAGALTISASSGNSSLPKPEKEKYSLKHWFAMAISSRQTRARLPIPCSEEMLLSPSPNRRFPNVNVGATSNA